MGPLLTQTDSVGIAISGNSLIAVILLGTDVKHATLPASGVSATVVKNLVVTQSCQDRYSTCYGGCSGNAGAWETCSDLSGARKQICEGYYPGCSL